MKYKRVEFDNEDVKDYCVFSNIEEERVCRFLTRVYLKRELIPSTALLHRFISVFNRWFFEGLDIELDQYRFLQDFRRRPTRVSLQIEIENEWVEKSFTPLGIGAALFRQERLERELQSGRYNEQITLDSIRDEVADLLKVQRGRDQQRASVTDYVSQETFKIYADEFCRVVDEHEKLKRDFEHLQAEFAKTRQWLMEVANKTTDAEPKESTTGSKLRKLLDDQRASKTSVSEA